MTFMAKKAHWLAKFQAWSHYIYTVDLDQMNWYRALGLRCLRVVLLTFQSLRSDQLNTQASALTYATLMSLVPLLGITLATLKGLGVHREFLDQIRAFMSGFPPEMITFIDETIKLVEETDFQKIGSIGALVLIYVSVAMLSRIENAFNKVWGVPRLRPLFRRVSNYISILVVVPVLMVAGITFLAQMQLGNWVNIIPFFAYLLPIGATWLAFGVIYAALPNTKVRLLPALVGGLLSGLVWLGWLNFYIYVQPGVTRYNVIYGTLASIPIFLIWVFGSWMIVLGGAFVTFAIQNQKQLIEDSRTERPSQKTRFQIAKLLLLDMFACFTVEKAVFVQSTFCTKHGIPAQWVGSVLASLIHAGWIVALDEDSEAYTFSQDPKQILVSEVAAYMWGEGAAFPPPKTEAAVQMEDPDAADDLPWQQSESINLEKLYELHRGFDNPRASGYSETRSA